MLNGPIAPRCPIKSMPFCGYAIPPNLFLSTKIFLSILFFFNRHNYHFHKHFAAFAPQKVPIKEYAILWICHSTNFFQFTKIFLSIKIYFNRHIYYLHKHFATFPHPIGSYQRVCHFVDMPFCQIFFNLQKYFC